MTWDRGEKVKFKNKIIALIILLIGILICLMVLKDTEKNPNKVNVMNFDDKTKHALWYTEILAREQYSGFYVRELSTNKHVMAVYTSFPCASGYTFDIVRAQNSNGNVKIETQTKSRKGMCSTATSYGSDIVEIEGEIKSVTISEKNKIINLKEIKVSEEEIEKAWDEKHPFEDYLKSIRMRFETLSNNFVYLQAATENETSVWLNFHFVKKDGKLSKVDMQYLLSLMPADKKYDLFINYRGDKNRKETLQLHSYFWENGWCTTYIDEGITNDKCEELGFDDIYGSK
jgi:hypothetical protein